MLGCPFIRIHFVPIQLMWKFSPRCLVFLSRSVPQSNVPKCEGLFEADEVFRDLNGMARGTKPGSDGLSVDFYITFWDTLGTDLVDVLNSSYRDGFLPSSPCKGLFNLTFKRGDRLDRKNWRPITLLSLEFKLCAPYRGCSSFASHSFCGPF